MIVSKVDEVGWISILFMCGRIKPTSLQPTVLNSYVSTKVVNVWRLSDELILIISWHFECVNSFLATFNDLTSGEQQMFKSVELKNDLLLLFYILRVTHFHPHSFFMNDFS